MSREESVEKRLRNARDRVDTGAGRRELYATGRGFPGTALGRHREDSLRANPKTLDAIADVRELTYDVASGRIRAVLAAGGITLLLKTVHPAAPYELGLADGADLVGRRVHVAGRPIDFQEGGVIVLSSLELLSAEPIGFPAVSLDVLEWVGRTAHCGAVALDAVDPADVGSAILEVGVDPDSGELTLSR
jgi:hypothetical protein